MAKVIEFTYKDKDYTLEFTRKTVERLEKEGFSLSDLGTKPMTAIPLFFRGAFYANHRFEKQEVIDEIFKKLPDKDELVQQLGVIYSQPFSDLFDEPEEDEGNVSWKVGKK